MKRLFSLCIMLLLLSYTWGQDTMPSDALDLNTGKLYLNSTYYQWASTSGTQNSDSGTYDIYSSTPANANTIYVQSGNQTINFWNLNIKRKTFLIAVQSSADITLNFKGTNYVKDTSTTTSPFLVTKATAAAFTINGDSLTSITTTNVVPLISPSGVNLSNDSLILNASYINLQAASTSSKAIGSEMYASFNKIYINDGCVFTVTGIVQGTKIIIGKASVKLSSFSGTVMNSNGDDVYCVTIPRNGTNKVSIKNNTDGNTNDYSFQCGHPGDDYYYIYLPNGSYTLSSNNINYMAKVNGSAVTATLAPIAGDGNIDVSIGDVIINDGEYNIGSQPYSYAGKVFTFSGSNTAYSVTINGGADTLKLNGVDIENSAACAFNINTGADITVVVNNGTESKLISGDLYAGLQKAQTNGILNLQVNGSLVATGGSSGAGVGSGYNQDFSNLTIKGKGTLVATGGSAAAGIGSGANGNCNNIVIENGNITATATFNAGGIGSGRGNCSNIYIKGGNITASTKLYAYTIGGFYISNFSNIIISGGNINLISGGSHDNSYLLPTNTIVTGGTILGKVITHGALVTAWGENSKITGGSVYLVDTAGNVILPTANHPTNGNTSDYLYSSRFKIPGINSVTQVSAITINDTTKWGCNEVFTNDSGMVYIWLPQNATTNDVTKVQIAVGNKAYTYSGYIDNYDKIVEASNGVSARGNYFYQVPVSITTSHATTTVADADGNAVTDGSFVSSGQLDDNKTRLSIAVAPEVGCKNASFTFDNLEKGSKYYKVTATAYDTIKINAVAVLDSFSVSFYNVDKTLLYKDTVAYDSTAVYGGYTPVRQATPEYSFNFKEWDSALSNIQSDITVYAVFDSTSNAVVGENKALLYGMKDNTIVETVDGSAANSTALIYVGNVAKTDNIRRRGLVVFGTSVLPKDVVIDSVKLKLSVSSASAMTIELYKMKTNWTEGSSYASGGMGVAATPYDVTWLHASYSDSPWSTPGGDYDATMITNANLLATDTLLTFSGDELKAQVKAYIADSASNCGWLLKSSDETTSTKGVIAKFYSKETAPTLAKKPTLEVYYHSITNALTCPATESDLTVYPVPAIDWVNISTSANIRSVKVLDLSGKVLLTDTKSVINVSPLAKGLYIMQISTDQGVFTRRLLKQ